MQSVQGNVSKVSTKEWYDSKKGQNINLYSFQLEGNNRWFRTGTNRPPCNQGDSVSFTVNEKGNVDTRSFQKGASTNGTQGNGGSARPAQAATGGGTNWAERDKYQRETVEPRITFQASRAQAVALVTAALANDALSFGSTAKGKKLDMLLEMVDQVTDRFTLQATHATEHLAELEADAAAVLESTDVDTEGDIDY